MSLMPEFTKKFDYGHVITIVLVLVSLVSSWVHVQSSIDNLQNILAANTETLKSNQETLRRIRDEQVRNSTLIDEHWGAGQK
jgi:ABC-type bacteriocin/lantibiotic exporter with double-glycine peptidase domain